jgi:hypothetical protein
MVGLLMDVSVNWTVSGPLPEVGEAVKLATGAYGPGTGEVVSAVVTVSVGITVGTEVSSVVGARVGVSVVGTVVSSVVGAIVGFSVGCVVTSVVGAMVGSSVGTVTGSIVGSVVVSVPDMSEALNAVIPDAPEERVAVPACDSAVANGRQRRQSRSARERIVLYFIQSSCEKEKSVSPSYIIRGLSGEKTGIHGRIEDAGPDRGQILKRQHYHVPKTYPVIK